MISLCLTNGGKFTVKLLTVNDCTSQCTFLTCNIMNFRSFSGLLFSKTDSEGTESYNV